MPDFIKPRIETLATIDGAEEISRIAADEEEITLMQAVKEFPGLAAFEYLPPAYLENYRLQRYEAKKLVDQITLRVVRTSSAVPMLCTGPACQVRHICSLREVREPNKTFEFPTGSPCPVEASLIELWRTDYYRTLKIDLQDKIERDRIEELLEIDLTMWYIAGVVAAKGHTIESTVGATSSGMPLFKTELNPLLDAKDRAAKRKDKILDELIATREAKEKSMLRKAKAQLMDKTNKDWFAQLEKKAVAGGIEIVKSPVEIAEAAKQIPEKTE